MDMNESGPGSSESVESIIQRQARAVSKGSLKRRIFNWFVPRYDESTLFLMAVTALLLYATDPTFRKQLSIFVSGKDIRAAITCVILACGFVLCLSNVFTSRPKNRFDKWMMGTFGVVCSAGSGIAVGLHMLQDSIGWLVVFPIWNIANGFLLLELWDSGTVAKDCVSDRNAALWEVLLGTAAVVTIFVICSLVFRLYWAITFCICVSYATSLDRAVQAVIDLNRFRLKR